MRRSSAILACTVLLTSSAAFAQTDADVRRSVALPGSLNISVGTLAPSEPDNVLASMTADQGFTVLQRGPIFVVAFMNVSQRHDSDAFAWNRVTASTAGAKIVGVTGAGVVQAVFGMSADRRPDDTHLARAAYVSYWTGWRADWLPAASPLLPDAFPGYMYASSGFITAAEPRNWISSAAMQQGATIFRIAGVSAIPYVGASATRDSEARNWNNRTQMDAGFKLTREVATGVVEVGVANRREIDRLTNDTRTHPIAYVNFWLGWNPRLVRR